MKSGKIKAHNNRTGEENLGKPDRYGKFLATTTGLNYLQVFTNLSLK